MKRAVLFGLAMVLLAALLRWAASVHVSTGSPAARSSEPVQSLRDEATLHKESHPSRDRLTAAAQKAKDLVPDSLDGAQSLSRLGSAAETQGDLWAARQYYQRALTLRERLAPNSLLVATSLNDVGVVVHKQGDLWAAKQYYERALAIREKLAPHSLDLARSLDNLGEIAGHQGDLTAAEEYGRLALALREKLAPDSIVVAMSLNNLGGWASQREDWAAAGDYLRRALAIRERRAPNSLGMARNLNDLGSLAEKQGNLSAARAYHGRALALREQLAPNSLDMAGSLYYLGTVAYKEGQWLLAEAYYRQALALQERLAPHSLKVAQSLSGLARVAEKQGDWLRAERWARRAWELVREQATAITGDEARQAFGASTASYAIDLVRYQLARGQLDKAFLTWEEGRAQALQQILLERHAITRIPDSPGWSEYRAAVAERDRAEQAASQASIDEARAQRELAARRAAGAAPDLVAQAQAALSAATGQWQEAQSAYTRSRIKADRLWADIKKRAPRAYAPPLTLKQARTLLPTGTLFMAFAVGEEQTHVFLLHPDRTALPSTEPGSSPRAPRARSFISAYTVAVSRKQLQARVDQFRAQVNQPARRTASLMASRALFAQLFPAEAQRALRAARRLLLSPDGPLWDVSFAALVTNATGPPRYLGADQAITYAPSLTLFAQSRNDVPRRTPGEPLSAVIVGHPVFVRPRARAASAASPAFGSDLGCYYRLLDGQPPDPLPDTEREAVAVAKLYGAQPLIGARATEAALRERIEQADVIHLATHGYWHPVRAMSSGVLLTIPEKESDCGETDRDGALQAWEIYSQLRLKAELVVLSACETGRGRAVPGEGIIGLTRALQYAGARSLLASQWAVADRSTAQLMVAFHRFLRRGWAKDEALRQAMALVRRNPATAHPYYWAAFSLFGDPDNPNLGADPARP